MLDLSTLTASPDQLRYWLEGSHVNGEAISFKYWYEHRQPINKTINCSGTILDIGCANGFLLRCLMAWTDHTLVPYGIDPDTELITRCRVLFPELQSHFASVPLSRLNQELGTSLPIAFDFVYWNVWDDFEFDDAQFDGYLENAYAAVKEGGRLILGFYDADVDRTIRKIEWLSRSFVSPRALDSFWNLPHEEAFVWVDKPTLAKR